jgi:Predicted GTPase
MTSSDNNTGQLKAKLAKLKRELLTPTGGGGGGGCEYSRPAHAARC